MAKHRHKEQESNVNDNRNMNMNNMNNNNNNPFGIDPIQLMNLLGGNFDISNMTNMLASMNTNGFNLGNLAPLAQMAGLNFDNNMMNGNGFQNTNDMMNNSGVNPGNNVNTGSINNRNGVPNMNNMNSANNMSNMNNINSSDNKQTSVKAKKGQDLKESKEVKSSVKSVNVNSGSKTTQNNDLEFLVSLKGIVNQDKVPLINKMIELYKSGAFKDK